MSTTAAAIKIVGLRRWSTPIVGDSCWRGCWTNRNSLRLMESARRGTTWTMGRPTNSRAILTGKITSFSPRTFALGSALGARHQIGWTAAAAWLNPSLIATIFSRKAADIDRRHGPAEVVECNKFAS